MDTGRRSITRPDGRVIEFLVARRTACRWCCTRAPRPGPVPATVQAARIRGLRVILAARPGYEGSTPRPARWWTWPRTPPRSWTNSARRRHGGRSGGGPHALACAAALPGRCLAAASIAGVAPYDVPGLDWLAGMGPENVAEFGEAVRGEAALTVFLDQEAVMLSAVTGESVAKSLGGLVIEADKAVLTGEFAEHVAACLRAALSSGIAGWRDDDLAFVRDWGFSLGWKSPAPDRSGAGSSGAGLRLAGRPGPDGPVRARAVAGRQHPGRPRSPDAG